MKKIIISFALLMFLFLNVYSQLPQKFNYQGVLRNSAGELVENTDITIKLTILEGSSSGTEMYIESHNVSTNDFGQFAVKVGEGTVLLGVFSEIEWSNQMFLKTEVANPLGASFADIGVIQLLSVPYAFYSEKAKVLDNNLLYFSDSDTLFAVKDREGNIVFAVFPDGAKVYTNSAIKGKVGGFAVSGRSPGKADTEIEYLRVTPDSTRIWVNDSATIKGKVGGFAVSGRSPGKGNINDYLFVTPDSTRIYINDTSITKGKVGGFAVSGRSPGKGEAQPFMDITKSNYFIGHEAGKSNTTGLYNSFFGYEAGLSNTEGRNGVFFGYKSGSKNTIGDYNTFIGNYTGYNNTEGVQNVFIGDSAGASNLTGHRNIFLGPHAGKSNIDGRDNIFVGLEAGRSNTSSIRNVFIGGQAGVLNTTGNYNVFIGSVAGAKNTIGDRNIFIGQGSGHFSDTAFYNVFIGDLSGAGNKKGISNVLIGWSAGWSNENGNSNVYLGEKAGYNAKGSHNVFIGSSAGYFESNSNRLYIENSGTGSTGALIYGEFDTDKLRLNAQVNIRDFMVLEPQSTAPESPVEGTVYFDNNDKKMKVWDGTTWQSLW